MNPVAVAARGKGALSAARRAGAILTQYGIGPGLMTDRLERVRSLVDPYGGAATLPVTAAALGRHPRAIVRYAEQGIEFPVHGYYHVDHIAVDPLVQDRELAEARALFERVGVPTVGFRAPYLRWNEGTLHALIENGFEYDSSQAYHWPIAPELETEGYRRGLEFYASLSAAEHPVVPRLEGPLVRIPCCLPDDESVVDRLALPGPEAIAALWLDVWERTDGRGELFTMQIHPERIEPCHLGVASVLEAADRAGAWIARLGEIATWWRARAAAEVTVSSTGPDRVRIAVDGPEGTTIEVGGDPSSDPARTAPGGAVEVTAERRPFVGVHPSCPPSIASFLRAHGFVTESSTAPGTHAVHIERTRFERIDELPLLQELAAHEGPLVRLSRWPNGARSAVAITGDIDALTIWDYAYRAFGR